MRAAPGAHTPRVFCKTLQGRATKALATSKGRLVCSSALLHSFMKGENDETRKGNGIRKVYSVCKCLKSVYTLIIFCRASEFVAKGKVTRR